MKKYKSKWRAEDKASGIAPNYIEINEGSLDLIERFNEDKKKQLEKIHS